MRYFLSAFQFYIPQGGMVHLLFFAALFSTPLRARASQLCFTRKIYCAMSVFTVLALPNESTCKTEFEKRKFSGALV